MIPFIIYLAACAEKSVMLASRKTFRHNPLNLSTLYQGLYVHLTLQNNFYFRSNIFFTRWIIQCPCLKISKVQSWTLLMDWPCKCSCEDPEARVTVSKTRREETGERRCSVVTTAHSLDNLGKSVIRSFHAVSKINLVEPADTFPDASGGIWGSPDYLKGR